MNHSVEQLARQSIQQRLAEADARSAAAQCRSRRNPLSCYLAGILHAIADRLDARNQATARPAR